MWLNIKKHFSNAFLASAASHNTIGRIESSRRRRKIKALVVIVLYVADLLKTETSDNVSNRTIMDLRFKYKVTVGSVRQWHS